MKKQYFEAAEVINRYYDLRSTYQADRQYAYMMIFDDDITAILQSIDIWYEQKKKNPAMKLVLVGGEGLLETAFKVMRISCKVRGLTFAASVLKKETEAQRLKRIALQLGVKEDDIIVADKGRNTSENLQAMSHIADGKKTLVVSTQRLALIFRQSVIFQCNTYPEEFGCRHFDYDIFVIHQLVIRTLRWYNFMAAGKGRTGSLPFLRQHGAPLRSL